MQRSKEPTELYAERDPRLVVEPRVGDLVPRQQPGAEERPREPLAPVPDECRNRDGNREEWGETRQHLELALDTGNGDRTPRKAKCPALLDDPDGVVPTLVQQPGRGRVQVRELLADERAYERLVNHDVSVPIGHRRTVAPLYR